MCEEKDWRLLFHSKNNICKLNIINVNNDIFNIDKLTNKYKYMHYLPQSSHMHSFWIWLYLFGHQLDQTCSHPDSGSLWTSRKRGLNIKEFLARIRLVLKQSFEWLLYWYYYYIALIEVIRKIKWTSFLHSDFDAKSIKCHLGDTKNLQETSILVRIKTYFSRLEIRIFQTDLTTSLLGGASGWVTAVSMTYVTLPIVFMYRKFIKSLKVKMRTK